MKLKSGSSCPEVHGHTKTACICDWKGLQLKLVVLHVNHITVIGKVPNLVGCTCRFALAGVDSVGSTLIRPCERPRIPSNQSVTFVGTSTYCEAIAKRIMFQPGTMSDFPRNCCTFEKRLADGLESKPSFPWHVRCRISMDHQVLASFQRPNHKFPVPVVQATYISHAKAMGLMPRDGMRVRKQSP